MDELIISAAIAVAVIVVLLVFAESMKHPTPPKSDPPDEDYSYGWHNFEKNLEPLAKAGGWILLAVAVFGGAMMGLGMAVDMLGLGR